MKKYDDFINENIVDPEERIFQHMEIPLKKYLSEKFNVDIIGLDIDTEKGESIEDTERINVWLFDNIKFVPENHSFESSIDDIIKSCTNRTEYLKIAKNLYEEYPDSLIYMDGHIEKGEIAVGISFVKETFFNINIVKSLNVTKKFNL